MFPYVTVAYITIILVLHLLYLMQLPGVLLSETYKTWLEILHSHYLAESSCTCNYFCRIIGKGMVVQGAKTASFCITFDTRIDLQNH